MANTHIAMTDTKKEQLKDLKRQDGRSLNWHINRAIDNYLKLKKAGKDE